ncbi:MAG: glycoside hydrolase, partial [Deltaproteobacteria bacterium]|nr:glycoside hydrolase [Deltaproteobacteria bacterium]
MYMVENRDRARVIFLWHMHQPSYEPPDGGSAAMPWVRLHATRAYLDLAWIFGQHPRVRMVVNFVPCLLDQLEKAAAGATDAFRELSLKAPGELTQEEKRFMAIHFFSCRQETMIEPVPRYRELFLRREVIHAWFAQDLLDLQVHFNLAWMGPAARAAEPLLQQLQRQGRSFTAGQKEQLIELQDGLCARIVPAWRKLAEQGQIELTTTPYYHPILPLVIDSEAALRCQPGATLPQRFSWPDDARLHVVRALERHEEIFGQRPVGMWPAEGAVSPEAVSLLGEHGVRWLATDEGILLRSLRPGMVREHVLYRPYRAPNGGPLLLFRDRDLSDRIGFTYGKEPTGRAVGDLVDRLRAAGEASIQRQDHPPGGPVILVALDGENPWDGYTDGGVDFLHQLCRALEDDPVLTTVLPRELSASEASELPRLHSGSWIDSSYRIWIGGAVENRAWTMLGQARRALAHAVNEGHPQAGAALEVLLPAEGSDWFWWFGDDFTTTQDMLFDSLFRARLRKVYQLLQLSVPPELE